MPPPKKSRETRCSIEDKRDCCRPYASQ